MITWKLFKPVAFSHQVVPLCHFRRLQAVSSRSIFKIFKKKEDEPTSDQSHKEKSKTVESKKPQEVVMQSVYKLTDSQIGKRNYIFGMKEML